MSEEPRLARREIGVDGLGAEVVRFSTNDPGWSPERMVQVTLGIRPEELGASFARMTSTDQAQMLLSIVANWSVDEHDGPRANMDMQLLYIWEALENYGVADRVLEWLERLVAFASDAPERTAEEARTLMDQVLSGGTTMLEQLDALSIRTIDTAALLPGDEDKES